MYTVSSLSPASPTLCGLFGVMGILGSCKSFFVRYLSSGMVGVHQTVKVNKIASGTRESPEPY